MENAKILVVDDEDYIRQLLALGLCVELAVDEEITNSQNIRTISAIVLDPRG